MKRIIEPSKNWISLLDNENKFQEKLENSQKNLDIV